MTGNMEVKRFFVGKEMVQKVTGICKNETVQFVVKDIHKFFDGWLAETNVVKSGEYRELYLSDRMVSQVLKYGSTYSMFIDGYAEYTLVN